MPDHGLGLGEHLGVTAESPEDGLRLVQVVLVGDRCHQVDAARVVGGDVHDRVAPDLAVGHEDRLVVGREEGARAPGS